MTGFCSSRVSDRESGRRIVPAPPSSLTGKLVANGKLGQPDHEVPLMVLSLVAQTRQRGVDILGTGGERLADDLDVPGALMLAPRWVKVLDPMRHLGGRGWVSHQADLQGLHGPLCTHRAEWDSGLETGCPEV